MPVGPSGSTSTRRATPRPRAMRVPWIVTSNGPWKAPRAVNWRMSPGWIPNRLNRCCKPYPPSRAITRASSPGQRWSSLIGGNDNDSHFQYKGSFLSRGGTTRKNRKKPGLRIERLVGPVCRGILHLVMDAERLDGIFQRLTAAYGRQGWWPGDGDPFEVIVGAILTQRTAWRNAEKAIARLREVDGLSLGAIRSFSDVALAQRIRPCGFFREKAKTLKAFVAHVDRRDGGDLARFLSRPMAELRDELLSIRGIGEETADAILLYAANQPSFVIDAYTRRLFERLGWIRGDEESCDLRARLMGALPHCRELFNEYHALIVRHGKERCRKVPRCAGCPVDDLCGVVREEGAS